MRLCVGVSVSGDSFVAVCSKVVGLSLEVCAAWYDVCTLRPCSLRYAVGAALTEGEKKKKKKKKKKTKKKDGDELASRMRYRKVSHIVGVLLT